MVAVLWVRRPGPVRVSGPSRLLRGFHRTRMYIRPLRTRVRRVILRIVQMSIVVGGQAGYGRVKRTVEMMAVGDRVLGLLAEESTTLMKCLKARMTW